MEEKLITIRVPGNALGLKYTIKGEDGYAMDVEIALGMYESVITPSDVLDMCEYVQSYAPQKGETHSE